MIRTDGTPTIANAYRPSHGGYPPSVPSAGSAAGKADDPRGAPAADAPSVQALPGGAKVGIVWQDHRRADVTFSLALQHEAAYAAACALDACEGCTLQRHDGYWQGEHEHAYTVSLIGPSVGRVSAIVGAVIDAGCTAVQVERWDGSSYACQEWRAA